MNRRRVIQLAVGLGTTGLFGCGGMQMASAGSDFEGVVWKPFETRMADKIIGFDFPVNVPGMTTFEFNPVLSDANQLVIALRTNEHIGLVHATSGVNIFIFIGRYRGVNRDGSWSSYYEFSTTQDAFDRITKERQEVTHSGTSHTHSLVRLGSREWIKTVSFWLQDGSHNQDEYRAILNKDYLISVSFGLGTRGKPNELRLAELRKVGERVVKSIRIE